MSEISLKQIKRTTINSKIFQKDKEIALYLSLQKIIAGMLKRLSFYKKRNSNLYQEMRQKKKIKQQKKSKTTPKHSKNMQINTKNLQVK